MQQMDYIHIDMKDVPRKFPFPYQVMAFGFTDHTLPRTSSYMYTDKIEFCIRLSSTEKFAEDHMGGCLYRSSFPHVIIKAPGVPHKNAVCGDRSAFHLIYSIPDFLILSGNSFSAPPFLWNIVLEPTIRELLSELRNLTEISRTPYAAERIDILSFQLLEELFKQRGETHEKNIPCREKIFQAASYLQKHYRNQIDLASLAEKLGLSERSFYRYWKKFFGDSPYQHILRLRLNEAQCLLKDSDSSVFSIAETVGFQDSCYFIRLFRRHFGITPHTFRRRHQEYNP